MEIILPAHINAARLLPFLGLIGQCGAKREAVTVDFSVLRRVSPAALAVLVATVDRWHQEKRPVKFRGIEACSITGYLQRMDVFSKCGLALPETFRRHDAGGRFVPVHRINYDVDAMGSSMAACVAPGWENVEAMQELYGFVWYVLTEIANNVHQHSGGAGFAAAQVSSGEGLVRLAIADNGRGILRSFLDARLEWARNLDDVGAIQKALEPMVSSRGSPTNEGVGLTLTTELARLAKGWLLIVSGDGSVSTSPEGRINHGRLPEGGIYPGTLIALTFKRSQIDDFAELLAAAKVRAGLLPQADQPGNFTP